MPNELPLPPEFQHLIEKRELPDRRKKDRRRSQTNADDSADVDGRSNAADSEDQPLIERRVNQDRRKHNRRATDN